MTMIPKIRFSEFIEEWKEMDFSEIAQRRSNSEISNDKLPYVEFEDINSGEGTLNKNLFEKDGCKKGILFSKGDVLFGKLRPYLKNILYADFKGVAVGDFWVLHSDVVDSNLLYTLVNSAAFMQVANISSGSKMPRADWNLVSSSRFCIPPTLSEQRRISQFFTLLDETIRLEGERLASLKQVKAASLQSFFPQEGEKEPRVRFKGFSGEWKKVKLSECLEISTERNLDNFYGKNDVLSVSEELGVRNQIELLGRSYAGQSVTNYNVLRTNQIVYTKSPLKAKPYGIVKVNKGETGIVSVLYAVYNVKEGISPDYIHWYFTPNFRLNNYLHPLVNKGAKNTMNISDEDALKGEIMIPSTLAEQRALSAYFTNIDEQIRLVSEKIEKMKKVKGACLEGMMV